jgi:serine/threonine protein kinase
VVHRDVQPANLLLREDGEVVLAGFALAARVTDKEEMRKRLEHQASRLQR